MTSHSACFVGKPLTDDLKLLPALWTVAVHNAERKEVGDTFRQAGALRLCEGGAVPRSPNQAVGHAVGILMGNNGEVESAVSPALRVGSQPERRTDAVRAWSHVRRADYRASMCHDQYRVALGAGGGRAASLEVARRLVEPQQFEAVVQVVAEVEGNDEVLVVVVVI